MTNIMSGAREIASYYDRSVPPALLDDQPVTTQKKKPGGKAVTKLAREAMFPDTEKVDDDVVEKPKPTPKSTTAKATAPTPPDDEVKVEPSAPKPSADTPPAED